MVPCRVVFVEVPFHEAVAKNLSQHTVLSQICKVALTALFAQRGGALPDLSRLAFVHNSVGQPVDPTEFAISVSEPILAFIRARQGLVGDSGRVTYQAYVEWIEWDSSPGLCRDGSAPTATSDPPVQDELGRAPRRILL